MSDPAAMWAFYVLLLLAYLSLVSDASIVVKIDKEGGREVEEKGAGWGYGGQGVKDADDWGRNNPKCDGPLQSPISFWDDDVRINDSIPMIAFIDYDNALNNLNLENNGHTIKIGVDSERPPKIRGGMLPDEYRLAQIHFHWGPMNTMGSEHKFGDDHFPFEMHLVHVRGDLTLAEALKDPQGLAVLGVFFEISNELDNTLSPITDVMDSAQFKSNKATINNLNLFSLLPHDTSNFFTYHGSLTTPPCSQVVIWSIFTETHAISITQLRQFRNVHVHYEDDLIPGEFDLGDKMLFNHRPAQPVNRRPIYARRHKVGLIRKCRYTSAASAASLASLAFLGAFCAL